MVRVNSAGTMFREEYFEVRGCGSLGTGVQDR